MQKIEPKTSFDECFATFPRLRAPGDLRDYWHAALLELKKTPVEPQSRIMLKRSLGWETMQEISFRSAADARVHGFLSVPRKRGSVPAVISFHDYGQEPQVQRDFTDAGVAHLAVRLRDHAELRVRPSTPDGVDLGPGLVTRHGLDRLEKSYPYLCFLDAIRSIDFMRLQKGIDPHRLAVLGHGFGAAMAVFAASQRADIKAIALERPGFVFLEGFLAEAGALYAEEIRQIFAALSPARRTKLRKSMDYLDVLNWAEVLDAPVLVSVGLMDPVNPPRSAFAFFNRLRVEKAMELFPEEGKDPDGVKERKKAVAFLASVLGGQGEPAQ